MIVEEILGLIAQDRKAKNPYLDVLGSEDLYREPTESEQEFFKSRPEVGGMMLMPDEFKYTLNPYSPLSKQEMEGVKKNELARLIMSRAGVPEFDVTPDQQESFGKMSQGKSYGLPEEIRATILGRILSGDPTAMAYTPQQKQYADMLQTAVDSYLNFMRYSR
jgi:hypothetical protein